MGNGNACRKSGTIKGNFSQYISKLWANIGWKSEESDDTSGNSEQPESNSDCPATQPPSSPPQNELYDIASETNINTPTSPSELTDDDLQPKNSPKCITEPITSPIYDYSPDDTLTHNTEIQNGVMVEVDPDIFSPLPPYISTLWSLCTGL